MEMLNRDRVAAAGVTDFRMLAQGLHARYLVDSFADGARFVAAVAAAGELVGHAPRAVLAEGVVDLKLISRDAVHTDAHGVDHVVDWTTQRDIDLALDIMAIAADHGLRADPASITTIELAIDTARSALIAPFWSALLTGDTAAHGRGTINDDVRDLTERVPLLWFQDTDEHETPRQRFHLDVWVAPEVVDARIAAALAAGGVVVDDREAPSFTVLADRDGNRACVCTS